MILITNWALEDLYLPFLLKSPAIQRCARQHQRPVSYAQLSDLFRETRIIESRSTDYASTCSPGRARWRFSAILMHGVPRSTTNLTMQVRSTEQGIVYVSSRSRVERDASAVVDFWRSCQQVVRIWLNQRHTLIPMIFCVCVSHPHIKTRVRCLQGERKPLGRIAHDRVAMLVGCRWPAKTPPQPPH